jgi:hypothetical protein
MFRVSVIEPAGKNVALLVTSRDGILEHLFIQEEAKGPRATRRQVAQHQIARDAFEFVILGVCGCLH